MSGVTDRKGLDARWLLPLLVLLAALWSSASAVAAESLHWTAGYTRSGYSMSAVACPARTLCVALDGLGDVLVSKDPGSGAKTWGTIRGLSLGPDEVSLGEYQLWDLACPSAHLCLIGDQGKIAYSTNPAEGASAWHEVALDSSNLGFIAAISCSSTHFCVALYDIRPPEMSGIVQAEAPFNGNVVAFTSTDPAGGAHTWKRGAPIAGDYTDGVSCPTPGLCVAGGQGGVHWTTHITQAHGSWRAENLHEGRMDTVACPSTKLCIAQPDLEGTDFISTDPLAGKWRAMSVSTGAVSCTSNSFCVATGIAGLAVRVSAQPAGGKHAWHLIRIKQTGIDSLLAVSCASKSFCVAVGDEGAVAVGQSTPHHQRT
jgi:hypothetical protein